MKSKTLFFIIFLVLAVLIELFLEVDTNKKIDDYLQQKSDQTQLEFQVIYNNYKSLADLIFKTHVNKKEILDLFAKRDRESLKNHLLENYNEMTRFSIRQLHFHLPNNDSFLRMHRLNKYGDNLTKDRSTVRYVNENQKYIDGFEEGKIFNGFRFVYPLFYDSKHIGSVEISFSALFFITEIVKSYNVHCDFLIKKAIVDAKVFKEEQSNYEPSPLEGYYYQTSIHEKVKQDKYEREIPQHLKSIISEKLDISKKPFSIYVKEFQEIATFIPLVNPISDNVVAYIKVNAPDTNINNKIINKYILLITLIIIIGLVLLFIYKQFRFQAFLKEKVEEKTSELNQLNTHLKDMVQKEVQKNLEKDKLMIAQSRHAAMGEMISMIAHQWRQPIAVVSMGANNILVNLELDMVEEKELKEIAEDILEQTDYLTKTIDDFKDFFKPGKKQELVQISMILDETFKIMGKSLENNNVAVEQELLYDEFVQVYSRELLQVFINIIKNAKEVLVEKEVNRLISIKTFEDDQFAVIQICDNGGGIEDSIKEKIFEPYFSTKSEKTGTGLGLYMSKTIVEKHLEGLLEVENTEDGACFLIKLPK